MFMYTNFHIGPQTRRSTPIRPFIHSFIRFHFSFSTLPLPSRFRFTFLQHSQAALQVSGKKELIEGRLQVACIARAE